MSFSGEGVGSRGLEVGSEFPLAGSFDIFEHGEFDFAVLKSWEITLYYKDLALLMSLESVRVAVLMIWMVEWSVLWFPDISMWS
jgi:hypothetical protein